LYFCSARHPIDFTGLHRPADALKKTGVAAVSVISYAIRARNRLQTGTTSVTISYRDVPSESSALAMRCQPNFAIPQSFDAVGFGFLARAASSFNAFLM